VLNEYAVGAQLLRQFGVRSVRLLTDDPVAAIALETYGISVVEQLPMAAARSVPPHRRLAVPVRGRSSQCAGMFNRTRHA
jgi:GTP cyclohydrolase II